MNKLEWDTADGVLDEADLWKLFSDHPDNPSEAIRFYFELKPLLTKMRLEDETRYYHIYRHTAGYSAADPKEYLSPQNAQLFPWVTKRMPPRPVLAKQGDAGDQQRNFAQLLAGAQHIAGLPADLCARQQATSKRDKHRDQRKQQRAQPKSDHRSPKRQGYGQSGGL